MLDDPFNSQDAFRRSQTIQEIRKIGKKCSQVIVLSHDASFLKDVWAKVPAAERASVLIVNAHSHGCRIQPWEIDRACLGRMADEISDLQAFLTNGEGKPLDVIKKMRPVLESHCRNANPGFFSETDWLGDILVKVREGGDDHPLQPIYDELGEINEYTKRFHHGAGKKEPSTVPIDSTELTGFVKRTLRIAKALPS